MKRLARVVHLWTGLIFGAILVVLGLTGSVLSWIHELDSMLNPGLLHVAPPAGMRDGQPMRIEPAQVQALERLLAGDARYGTPSMLELPGHAGGVFVAWYRPAAGAGKAATATAVTRQVMLDPANLTVVGERNWGEAGLTRPLLMPTLFHVHRYLVAGETGKVVVAVTGVSLALAILTGMFLWWPRMTRSAIWHALTVRHGGSWPRFNFQLHRAGGFFAAPLLLIMALSGVYFNMPQWVKPVVAVFLPLTPVSKVVNKSAPARVGIGVSAALIAAQTRFPEGRVSRISFPPDAGQPFEIRVRQPGELRQGPGATRISVDAGDGSVLRVIDPERARGGDKLLSWLFPLHTGEAFGLAGRIFVSLVGFLPLMFFVTGLVIWVKLRRKALMY
ncbi:PepSY domain-containing protein [Massilia glaciei]|uniref:PepSY domain-containing protein n=2 Tax=Massilia glaciei TaxID=1524097 RepID=A0A2U2HFZ8_9BURK|nr:PepSY domain-containing protein [Massilia glaciei]